MSVKTPGKVKPVTPPTVRPNVVLLIEVTVKTRPASARPGGKVSRLSSSFCSSSSEAATDFHVWPLQPAFYFCAKFSIRAGAVWFDEEYRFLTFFILLQSCDCTVLVSPQVQTVLYQLLPTPPSGAGRSSLSLDWPEPPTRPWWIRESCGWWEATSSTPPTIRWSKRKCSSL